MAVSITHAHVATGTNAGNGEVAKEEWNEEHVVTGLGTAAEADTTDFATAAQGAKADTAVQPTDTSTASMQFVIDEDSFASNLATKVPTQQSVKAYADSADSAWYAAAVQRSNHTGTQAISTVTNLQTSLDAKLNLAGGTMSGELIMADQLLTRALMKDYGLEAVAHGSTGSTETIDLTAGNAHTATLDQSCTWTFSNPTASGDFCSFCLLLTNGGAFTNTWPASVDWDAATAPTLQSSGSDLLVFFTFNGGTDWYGYHVWASA